MFATQNKLNNGLLIYICSNILYAIDQWRGTTGTTVATTNIDL
jgi:hypothetical protein